MTILLYDLVGAGRSAGPSARIAGRPRCRWRTRGSIFAACRHRSLGSRSRGRRVENGAGHSRRRQGGRAIPSRSRSTWTTPIRTVRRCSAAKAARRWRASSSAGRSSRFHPYLGAAVLTDIHARLAPPDQAYFRESRETALRQEARGGLGRARGGARRLPRLARAAAQHADLPALHRRQRRRSIPTISSLARSSGCASCRPTRCLANAIPVPDGSSAASISMAGSAAKRARRRPDRLRRLASPAAACIEPATFQHPQ